MRVPTQNMEHIFLEKNSLFVDILEKVPDFKVALMLTNERSRVKKDIKKRPEKSSILKENRQPEKSAKMTKKSIQKSAKKVVAFGSTMGQKHHSAAKTRPTVLAP